MTILKGILAYILSDSKTRKLARERKAVCDSCPFNSNNTARRPYGWLPFKPHCTDCGCWILLKIYGQNSCPQEKWN